MPRRRALLAASLPWGAASTRAGALTAATERPIRVLVPYTPGAINDILARLIAERFQEVLGQLGVVENRPGASGSLALAATAQAAPDGGTIVIANTANLAMNPFLFANTGYDPQKDLAPLATVARVMNVMVVPAASPFRSPADVVAAAKVAPGQLTFASSGAGSSPHLAAELFKARSGTDITHVPYKGSAPAVADLLAGRLSFSIDNLPNALPHIQDGRLRPLAVTGSERDPALPEVPTFAEAGIADTVVYVWFGFVGPAGLLPATRQRLSDAILRIAGAPDTAERIRRGGASPYLLGPTPFAALIAAELATWGQVIRDARLRME
jgi:tripartite-type tricarboxylate transporter receptor subunit TctC